MTNPARDRGWIALALFGSFLTGLGLRVWNLWGQILGGDELHAVRAAIHRTLPEILTTYALTDSSIPLTALFRFLLERGVTLSEIDFRLPSLLCGLIAVVAIPRAFIGRVDRGAVELLGFLVALSPLLLLYSRIARSYMPMVLLAFLAVMAFEAWWRTRSWRAGAAYVALSGLAAWLHLGAAPFVAAPFLFAVGDLLWTRERLGRRLLELTGLGLALTAAFALFLVPARESLQLLVANKRREQALPPDAVWDMLRLQAGTPSSTVAVLFWLAAIAGLVLLLRDRPRLGAYTLTLTAGQVAGMLLLSPAGIGNPLVLNRYLLPALPFILLWVSYALVRPWNPGSGCAGRIGQRAGARLFLLLLFWTGPFLSPGFRRSSFMHHNDFVGFFAPRATLPDDVVPAFYRQVPPGPVLEYPWPTIWRFGRSFYIYQRIHEQRVLVSAPIDFPRHPRIRFRNEVAPEPAALLASPARSLVVHLKLGWEEDRVVSPGRAPERGMRPRVRRGFRRAGEVFAERLAKEWGPPDYADALVRVWDLERLRWRREGK